MTRTRRRRWHAIALLAGREVFRKHIENSVHQKVREECPLLVRLGTLIHPNQMPAQGRKHTTPDHSVRSKLLPASCDLTLVQGARSRGASETSASGSSEMPVSLNGRPNLRRHCAESKTANERDYWPSESNPIRPAPIPKIMEATVKMMPISINTPKIVK